jgi:hypothetical protein
VGRVVDLASTQGLAEEPSAGPLLATRECTPPDAYDKDTGAVFVAVVSAAGPGQTRIHRCSLCRGL